MPFLKERIATIEYQRDFASTFALLIAKLAELDLSVESASRETDKIVASCPSLCFNLMLWRCWSDSLLLTIERAPAGKTKVHLHALPNLLKWRIKKGEKLVDVSHVVSALQIA